MIEIEVRGFYASPIERGPRRGYDQIGRGLIGRHGRYGIGFFSVFMWGNRIRVTTRTAQSGPSETRILEFQAGLESRPILRKAKQHEQLTDPGTVVRVWLSRRLREDGGILGTGTYEFSQGERVSRKTPWSLKDLCVWLCPTIDVEVRIDENGQECRAIGASDWLTIEPLELLRRTLLGYDNCDEIIANPFYAALAKNLRPVKDAEGRILGRACINRLHDSGTSHTCSIVTAGAFRANPIKYTPGILLGRPVRATRDWAEPLIAQYRKELAKWATEQSRLIQKIPANSRIEWSGDNPFYVQSFPSEGGAAQTTNEIPASIDPAYLSSLFQDSKERADQHEWAWNAALIRAMGGNTGPLPIVRIAQGYLSYEDIVLLSDLPDEVVLVGEPLFDSQWHASPVPPLLPGVFAVAMGHMKSLWFGVQDQTDVHSRANHAAWDRFWMSLTGATIEAIAKAWGEPLQDVLEASEFSTDDHSLSAAVAIKNGEQVVVKDVDIIRKPNSARRPCC